MEEKNSGVLQASGSDITLVVSKAPICSPTVSTIPAGQSYQEIVDSLTGISEQHTKVFQDGVLVEDWSGITVGGNVAVAQIPEGLSPLVVGMIISAVIGAALGYLMYESPETVSEGEKQRRVQGDRNQNKGYEPLPYILGRRKITPAYAAYPYTKWVGQQQYYYMLLHVGYGPLKIEDVKIGDVSISNFDDDTEVAWVDWYENRSISPLKAIWSTNTSQITLNQEIPRVDNFLASSIPVGVGKTEIVYNFPQGLVWQAGRGPVSVSASIQFEYQGGDGRWYTPVKYHDFKGKASGFVPPGAVIKNFGEMGRWFLAGNASARKWGQNLQAGKTINNSGLLGGIHYDDGRGNAIVDSFAGSFIASRSHVNKTASAFTESISFDVSKAGNPNEEAPIGFRATHSSEENRSSKPVMDRIDLLTISRSAPITTQDFSDIIGIPTINGDPNLRHVILALKIRASEQLSGTVDDLNVIATSVVPTDPTKDWRRWYTGGGNLLPAPLALGVTNNPADLYRWVLQGPMNPAAVKNEKIDLESINDWRQTCVTEGWETSALMNEAATLKDTLSNIAKTGRAQFSMKNGIFSVVENVERTVPVQVFTPKNSRDFSSKRVFPDPSDGITIEFQNEDEDFEVDEWTYYDPTITVQERVGQTDSMEMWGIAKPELAQKHARFAYFEKQLRRETYTLTTDTEGLVCGRGHLVRVANDVVDIGLGQGFIRTVAGSTFTVDETTNLTSGNVYGMTIRSVDSGVAIETIQVTYNGGGEWTASTIPAAGLNVGDLVSYGELGKETLDCVVQNISYGTDYEATLTLVNAANIIYTYDGDGLPAYETALTPKPERFPPAAPTVTVSDGSSSYNNPTLKVTVKNSSSQIANITSYQLQYRIGDTFWEAMFEGEEEPEPEFGVNLPEGAVWVNAGFSDVSNGVFQVPIENNIGSQFFFRAKAYGTGNLTSDWSEEVTSTVSDMPAPDVVDFNIVESVNDPKTPDGMYSTFTVTVVEPSEAPYLYSIVEYRTPSHDPYDPANPWFPISKVGWKFATQAEVTVLANGTQYEFRVRSVSTWGVPNVNGLRKIVTTTNTQSPEYTEDNPFEALPVPNVTGLELFEQGNNTEFTGKDAKFVWRKSSVGDWVDLGYEGLRGAGASRLDQYFRDYQVEVWSDNKTIRTEFVVDAMYTYTYEKNAEDYERENGIVGAYRDFEVRVLERGRNNQISQRSANLAVTNTAPKALQNLSIIPGFNVVEISYDRPVDLDFAGIDVWVSETQGFNPDMTVPFKTISDNTFTAGGLAWDTTYYIRLRPFDAFGRTDTNTSAEFVIKTLAGIDINGLSGWAYEVDPVDRTFIEQNLAGDAIPSEKIANVTAAKITTGTLQATETITSEGLIRAVDDANNPQAQTGIGPTDFGTGTTYLMWAYNGTDITFGVDELGNVRVTGAITIAAGSSGIAQLADAGALATKDSVDWATEVGGTGKPENNATVGAIWGSTVSNIPARITNTATTGLNITDSYIGYYDGTSFRSYIQSNGSFHFGSSTNNYLDYNGSKLVIETDEFSVDSSGNASFSGSLNAASGTFSGALQAATGVLGNPSGNRVEYNGTNLIISTPEFSVDASGNANFSGSLGANTVTTNSIRVGDVNTADTKYVTIGPNLSTGIQGVSGTEITLTTLSSSVVTIFAQGDSAAQYGWDILIRRTGTAGTTYVSSARSMSFDQAASFNFAGTLQCFALDKPGAGTHTYSISIRARTSTDNGKKADSFRIMASQSKV